MWYLVRRHNAAKLRYLQKRTAYSKQLWCALCQKVSEAYEEDDRNNLARQIAELKLADRQNAPKTAWKNNGENKCKTPSNPASKVKPPSGLVINSKKDLMEEWRRYFANLFSTYLLLLQLRTFLQPKEIFQSKLVTKSSTQCVTESCLLN